MEEIDKFIYEFNELLTKEKRKLPYHINLIDEITANENAHSRILMKLLSYSNESGYIFLKSFVELIGIGNFCQVLDPNFTTNKDYIDGLVKESGKYAIIIENKIHNAVDQPTQIETYIERLINQRFNKQQIYVVYLTRDGSKKISDLSLTQRAKDLLEYNTTNDSGRYICINYLEHILPWLEDTILPNCRNKEEWLVSALQQYIDHLEGMFYKRKNEMAMNEHIKKFIEDKFDLQQTDMKQKMENIIKYINQLNQLGNALEEYKKGLLNRREIIENNLKRRLEQIAQKYELDYKDRYDKKNNGAEDAYFYFYNKPNYNIQIKFYFGLWNYNQFMHVIEQKDDQSDNWHQLSEPKLFSKYKTWDYQFFIDLLTDNSNDFFEELENVLREQIDVLNSGKKEIAI